MSHPLFDNMLVKLDQELADLELEHKLWTPRGTAEGASDYEKKIHLVNVENKAIITDTRDAVLTWLTENPVTEEAVELGEAHDDVMRQNAPREPVVLPHTYHKVMSRPWFENMQVKLEQELAYLELQLKLWTPRGTAEGASDYEKEIHLLTVNDKKMVLNARRTVVKWLTGPVLLHQLSPGAPGVLHVKPKVMSRPYFENWLVEMEQDEAYQELKLKLWTLRGTAEGASDHEKKMHMLTVKTKENDSHNRHLALKWLTEHPVVQKVVELREAPGPDVPHQILPGAPVVLHDTLKDTANTCTVQVQRLSQAYRRKATTHS